MPDLKKMDFLIKGEGSIRTVPEREIQRLNNEHLSRYKCNMFMLWLFQKGRLRIPINVIFSTKKIDKGKLLGIALPWCRTIKLYRHSVWLFLHELSHIYEKKDLHGVKFTNRLQKLYKLWLQYDKEGFQINGQKTCACANAGRNRKKRTRKLSK